MLAVRYYGIREIRIENVERPECGPGEVLVKVAYAGICGSDLHVYRKGMFVASVPVTMGHEFSGVVAEVGSNVSGVRPGDHVVGDPRVPCGSCQWCRQEAFNLCPDLGFIGEVSPGCFAEYVVMSPSRLLKVPPVLDLRAAALAEPLAVAVRILRKGGFTPDTTLGIIGAGPIGLLALILAKTVPVGQVTVIDISPPRLELAGELGADKVLATFPKKCSEGVDVVIEAAGTKAALEGALKWLKPQGKLILAGLYEEKVNVDYNEVIAKEVGLVGSNAYDTADLKKAIELLVDQRVCVDPVISHIFPLKSACEAFSMADQRSASKILFAP